MDLGPSYMHSGHSGYPKKLIAINRNGYYVVPYDQLCLRILFSIIDILEDTEGNCLKFSGNIPHSMDFNMVWNLKFSDD